MRLFVAALLCLGLLLFGHVYLAALLVVAVWFAHELLWCDRRYYSPKIDYRFNFDGAEHQTFELGTGKGISIPSAEMSSERGERTVLLETRVAATTLGRVFDPYVTIDGNQRQYFERGAHGRRYINLSHIRFRVAGQKTQLKFRHCRSVTPSVTVRAFPQPELDGRRIMLLAPHADDAEIAAFGLYSAHAGDSMIVTVTAGEVDAGYYEALTGDPHQASRMKGLLRSWDSVAIPQWGGLRQDQCVQLGYFCMTLGEMAGNPGGDVPSASSRVRDTRVFRRFNDIRLETDIAGKNCWCSLVSDLVELVESSKPEVIVAPHPCYDPHPDHYFSSRALAEALARIGTPVEVFLLYANHHRFTEDYPFGRSGSIAALPPELGSDAGDERVFSFELDAERQQKKLMALRMMHDLRVPSSLKKRCRKALQHALLGRERCPYGDDDFLRKAVRANEVFFVCDYPRFKALTAGDWHGYL